MGKLARFIYYYTNGRQGAKPDPGPDPVEKTVSGSIIHITDALAAPAVALSTAISPVQDLHGYENPWPAGGGANKWDEEWEPGGINNGTPVTSQNQIRSKNFNPILPDTSYYATCGKTDGGSQNRYYLLIAYYDASKQWISNAAINNLTFTTPANAAYFKIYTNSSTVVYGNEYHNDIAVNYPATVTTYSPYSNICPITGWDEANIVVSPTQDAQDGTTYTVSFGSAGTVYGGTLDVVNGTLTVDREIITLDGVSKNRRFYGKWEETDSGSALYITGDVNRYPAFNASFFASNVLTLSGDSYAIMPLYSFPGNSGALTTWAIIMPSGMSADDGNAWLQQMVSSGTPVQVVRKVAEPFTITLTPTEVQLLLGENYVWSDTGDSTLTYLADGRASTSEALGILLGGMYNPSADVPDNEALQIILGETT